MSAELDKLKAKFLASDVDEETRTANEEDIRAWEQALIQSEAFIGWRDHDITRQIVGKAKESYKDFAFQLMQNRNLTETQRLSLFARQDACTFILSLTEIDAKSTIVQIHKDIRHALNAV